MFHDRFFLTTEVSITILMMVYFFLTMTRTRLYKIIFETNTKAGRLFDEILLGLIFCSVVIVMLRSMPWFDTAYPRIIHIQRLFTLLFTLEYVLRVWIAKSRSWYVFSFFGVIDLLAILPSFLGFMVNGHHLMMLRSLRLLRLFRVFKLGKYTSASSLLRWSLQASWAKITVFLLSVLVIVLVVGTLMFIIEWPVSGFDSIPTSVYRAIVTITTVGYGDITPITPIGQFLSATLMIVGYGIIAVPTGLVSAHLVSENARRSSKKKTADLDDVLKGFSREEVEKYLERK